MRLEDFRVYIKRCNDTDTERQQVDQMILQLLQMQMIDATRAANLIGRGVEDDLWQSVREYAKEKDLVQQQMQKQQQAQLQQQQAQMGQMQKEQITQEQMSKDEDRQYELDAIILKQTLANQGKSQQPAKKKLEGATV